MQQMFHAHNIKRTILKQKHNTENSYYNNNLSITPDSDNQASLNKNQTTNLLQNFTLNYIKMNFINRLNIADLSVPNHSIYKIFPQYLEILYITAALKY